MTRRPFDPGELDRPTEGLEQVAAELEGYSRLAASDAPPDLANRVMADVAGEPPARRGVLAALSAPFMRGTRGGSLARMALVAGTMALAVLAVVAAGRLAELLRNPQVGPSPAPSVMETPLVSPAPSSTPSAPSPTPTPSPSASPSSASGATSEPSESETPEPSDDDNSGPGGGGGGDETPEPLDDDNSGPGGGGGDD